MTERLSSDVVSFLLRGLISGRISRATACDLVTPWVEGTLQTEPLLEDAAQLIHGFDIVLGDDGLERHQSQGGEGELVITQAELAEKARRWLTTINEANP